MFGKSKQKCNHPASKLGKLRPFPNRDPRRWRADCKCGARDVDVGPISKADRERLAAKRNKKGFF